MADEKWEIEFEDEAWDEDLSELSATTRDAARAEIADWVNGPPMDYPVPVEKYGPMIYEHTLNAGELKVTFKVLSRGVHGPRLSVVRVFIPYH